MKFKLALATSGMIGALLVSSCNQAPETATDNVAAANEVLAENAAIEAADAIAAADEVEEATAAQPATIVEQPVQVVQVPAPPPSAPPAAAAPLTDAASTARRIRDSRDIVRIPYQGGWAWRENGRIVRTSSSDGRRVSYFRPGEDKPYFVQDGDRGYAYSGGRIQRGYDSHGNPVAVDQSRRQRGEQLAREATEDRSRANRNDSDRGSRQPEARDRQRTEPPQGRSSDQRMDRDRSQSRDKTNEWRRNIEPTVVRNGPSTAEPANSSATPDRRHRSNDRSND